MHKGGDDILSETASINQAIAEALHISANTPEIAASQEEAMVIDNEVDTDLPDLIDNVEDDDSDSESGDLVAGGEDELEELEELLNEES
jgi:hypothetical protein